MIVSDVLRRVRLQALMARQLVNWRQVWHAYVSGAETPPLRFRNGMVLHSGGADSAGFLFLEIFANGCYRQGLPNALSGVAVNIGANIGAFTLDIAARHRDLVVHAYEPDADAFAMLRRNLEANGLTGRVRAWNEAVAGAAGTLPLWRGEGSIVASAYLLPSERGECRDVPAVTLQTVVERCAGRIALLKMDCEGAEADILEHAGTALDAVDRIVAEYHAWLVPDVVSRLRGALTPAFDVTISDGGRCGPMLRALRRHD